MQILTLSPLRNFFQEGFLDYNEAGIGVCSGERVKVECVGSQSLLETFVFISIILRLHDMSDMILAHG